MQGEYIPPKFQGSDFHCPLCNVYAHQIWYSVYTQRNSDWEEQPELKSSCCLRCHEKVFWHNEKIIIPSSAPVPMPHIDMPEDCMPIYNEAREIAAASPKASAALMRLVIQKLMPHIGGKGKHIDTDIKTLVANGLPEQVQQALDVCRVVGNNGVHPGEINIDEDPDVAHQLFSLVNFIVEDRISRPNKIKNMFNALPAGAKEAVKKRDKATTETP